MVLSQPGPVRERWERRGRSSGTGTINLSSISRVVAEHLWDAGERPDTDLALARSIKDRTRRALAGTNLSHQTLRWFIDAFELGQDDARRLEALLAGSPAIRALVGDAVPVVPSQRRHRTLSLREHHYLGPDGRPATHRTAQTLEATEDGLDNYLYIFDTSAVTVDVVQGGQVTGPLLDLGHGLYAVRITLTRPLSRGETTSIEYHTVFSYTEQPAPEFRRAALTAVNSMDIRVQFDPARRPRAVYLTEWSELYTPPATCTPVTLEPDHSVGLFLTRVDRAIIGYTWEW
jgi:hypothetical protein